MSFKFGLYFKSSFLEKLLTVKTVDLFIIHSVDLESFFQISIPCVQNKIFAFGFKIFRKIAKGAKFT